MQLTGDEALPMAWFQTPRALLLQQPPIIRLCAIPRTRYWRYCVCASVSFHPVSGALLSLLLLRFLRASSMPVPVFSCVLILTATPWYPLEPA